MIEQLRKDAKELLEKGEVELVIGFEESRVKNAATPVFIKSSDDVEKLVLNPFCYNNLATYLTHPQIRKQGKPAIVAKKTDIMTLIALVQETQIAPEDFVILGVDIAEIGKEDSNIDYIGVMSFAEAEKYIADNVKTLEMTEEQAQRLEALEKMDMDERWDFWIGEFDRCIKCYACRQACPMCYCQRCIVEKNQPQWVSTNINTRGALAWNIIRAFHLAGRCIGCGECERVCPVDIPLMTLNKFLAKAVFDEFGYITGVSSEEKPPLTVYRENDVETFIK